MIIVKCPKCKHNQNVLPRPGILTVKSKRCVYCGFTFKIHADLKKSRIVEVKR
ncbi:MAG: hypothetical protein WC916_01210 [Candidatus Woesearchaeota archaeon]